jgi:FkbM family methyltransferase
MLLENATRNQLQDRLIAVQSAVSDNNNMVNLHTSTFNTGDHQLFHQGARDSIEVACTTLDSYLPAGTSVDVIKMDVQGAEAAAFKGMKRVLDDNHNIQVIWELSPSQLEDAGSRASEVLYWLEKQGFSFSSIDESTHSVQEQTIEEILQKCPHHSFLNILSSRNG